MVKAPYSNSMEAYRVQLEKYLVREGTDRNGERAALYGTDFDEYRSNMTEKNFRVFLSPQSGGETAGKRGVPAPDVRRFLPSGETKERKPGPEIACSSTDPEKYLGQYLAAVSLREGSFPRLGNNRPPA